ncbi:MAG: VWA domain-containing protein [Chloroherpetonaceae bacterium]|nr:VWA domain-containing protein [Chloroherpetonaceae bacterium]
MRFGNPTHLYYLFALIPLLIFLVFFLSRRFAAVKLLGDSELMQELAGSVSRTKLIWKLILIFLAAALILFAYAAPQLGTRLKEVKRKGIEVVIALDVSNSMQAEDIRPSRLQKAKYEISRFIDQLGGDRVGLVVFAGQSYLQCPMTLDKSSIKLFLDIVSPEVIETQGTNFAAAIRESLEAFKSIEEGADASARGNKPSKVIIIFSDGEDHEAGWEEMVDEALVEGVKVYTVGIGSPSATPIPIYDKSMNRIDYKRGSDGEVAMTKFVPDGLRRIAEKSGASFYQINAAGSDFDKILVELDKLQKTEFASRESVDYEDQFQYFIGVAIALLVLESLLGERIRKVKK